jgi:hypothetical protein
VLGNNAKFTSRLSEVSAVPDQGKEQAKLAQLDVLALSGHSAMISRASVAAENSTPTCAVADCYQEGAGP